MLSFTSPYKWCLLWLSDFVIFHDVILTTGTLLLPCVICYFLISMNVNDRFLRIVKLSQRHYIQAEVSWGWDLLLCVWTEGRGFWVGCVQKVVPGVWPLSWLLMRSHLRPCAPWTWPHYCHLTLALICQSAWPLNSPLATPYHLDNSTHTLHLAVSPTHTHQKNDHFMTANLVEVGWYKRMDLF